MPSLKDSIAGWLDALDLSATGVEAEAVLSTEEDPARWQAAWEETAPGISLTLAHAPAVPGGAAPTLPAAQLLWELGRRLRTGGTGIVIESVRGRSGFAGFRLEGPVRWLGSWASHGAGRNPPGVRFLDRAFAVTAVSQGAYVPHPRYQENLASRWRLEGERCAHCGALTFPTTGRCRWCGRNDGLRAESLPRTDLEVEAVTTISSGAQPTEFDPLVDSVGAYDVALVSLAPDVRATVQVTDSEPGRLRIHDRVGLVLRRLYAMEGEWRYGLKAVPVTDDARRPESAPDVSRSSRSRRGASSGVPTARRATPRARGGRPGPRRRPGR